MVQIRIGTEKEGSQYQKGLVLSGYCGGDAVDISRFGSFQCTEARDVGAIAELLAAAGGALDFGEAGDERGQRDLLSAL